MVLSAHERLRGDPVQMDWSAAISKSALKTKLTRTDSRLISVHRPDGAADVPFTAVWIANKGTDKTSWDWNPGSTSANLDALVNKGKGRLIHIDAFTVTGTGVRFAGIWVTNTGSFKRDWGWDPALTSAQLKAKVGRSQRIISLTTYVVERRRLYAAVWVKNTGAEHRDWSWAPSATYEELRQELEDLPGRLVSVDTFKEGTRPRHQFPKESDDSSMWPTIVGLPETATDPVLSLFAG
jgi:Polyglycine hydrolase-like, structural repeat